MAPPPKRHSLPRSWTDLFGRPWDSRLPQLPPKPAESFFLDKSIVPNLGSGRLETATNGLPDPLWMPRQNAGLNPEHSGRVNKGEGAG
jgi:hypothetical protein